MLRLETYKLFVATGIVCFLFGIIVFNNIINIALHDVYIVIYERHIVIVVCSLLILYSLIYFWLYKLNKPMNDKLGKIHFILTLLSIVATYKFMQNQQLNTRYIETVNAFEMAEEARWADAKYFQAITIIFAVGQIAFLVNVLTAITKKT